MLRGTRPVNMRSARSPASPHARTRSEKRAPPVLGATSAMARERAPGMRGGAGTVPVPSIMHACENTAASTGFRGSLEKEAVL